MSNKNVGAAASDFLPLRTTEAEEETAAASLSCLSIYLSALLGSVCGVAWAGCCRAGAAGHPNPKVKFSDGIFNFRTRLNAGMECQREREESSSPGQRDNTAAAGDGGHLGRFGPEAELI